MPIILTDMITCPNSALSHRIFPRQKTRMHFHMNTMHVCPYCWWRMSGYCLYLLYIESLLTLLLSGIVHILKRRLKEIQRYIAHTFLPGTGALLNRPLYEGFNWNSSKVVVHNNEFHLASFNGSNFLRSYHFQSNIPRTSRSIR